MELDAKQGALLFASRGIRVFPLKPGSKDVFSKKLGDDPFLSGGINIATRDPKRIESWFAHNPNINYGMCTAGHAVLDLDPRKDPDGWILDLAGIEPIPKTLQVATPSGGTHIWFNGLEAGQRKLKDATTIDVRGRGGYVVGPGSTFAGKRYRIIVDAPPAPVPPAIRPRLSLPGERAADSSAPVCELDTPGALAYGEDLVMRAHGAAQGDRNSTLHLLASTLKDKGVARETSLHLLTEHWCPKCDPPYEDFAEIEKSIASAYDNGLHPPGCDAPELQFDDLSSDPDLADYDRRRTSRKNIVSSGLLSTASLLERFRDISLADLVDRQSMALVKGILHPRDAAVLYGESRAGKSFIGLDLGWHVAQGKPWHGRKVNRAPVLYVALEGVDGFRKRMLSIGKEHGDPGLWFARLNLPAVSLVKNEKTGGAGMVSILKACKQLSEDTGQQVGLIVIDTYARATAGDDENATDAVMHYVEKRAGELARRTGAATLTIAHTNRSGDLRGSLHLRNSADVVLKAERSPDGEERSLIGEKVKDGAEVTLFDFTLEPVELAKDADGDALDSCVIRAAPAKPRNEKKWTGPQKRLVEAYNAVRAETQKSDVPLPAVRDEFEKRYATGERNNEKAEAMKRSAWNRAIKEIPAGFKMEPRNGTEYLCKTGRTDPSDEFEAIDE